MSAWLLALATGLAVTIWEREWLRIRVAVLTFAAMPLLQFVALARFSGTLNWHGAGAWVYVAFFASILLLGAFGIRRCWFAREEQAPLAAAASH